MIRVEEAKDRNAVHALNASVFATPAEADLVDLLGAQSPQAVSLVAEQDGEIVGHIMFTPVGLVGHRDLKMMGLAPMAVAPRHQRQGIGSALVHAGLNRCRRLGFGAVVVLGHADYYPRFGFTPAAHFGISCEFSVPDDAFMVRELSPDYLRGAQVMIRYAPAFRTISP